MYASYVNIIQKIVSNLTLFNLKLTDCIGINIIGQYIWILQNHINVLVLLLTFQEILTIRIHEAGNYI